MFLLGDSSAASGQHDRITDFTAGVDRIDLSGIDAISGTAGYDQFHFMGTAGFTGSAGDLNYFYNSSLGVTTLQGDTNGDRVADFAIDLSGNVVISAASLNGIVTAPTVIEAIGSTSLVEVGSNFYLNNISGGSRPLAEVWRCGFCGRAIWRLERRSVRRRRRRAIRLPGRMPAPVNTRPGTPTTTATTFHMSAA